MRALLLSTYEQGRQPLGLAGPLAHLRAAGIPARGVDLAVAPLPADAVAAAGLVAFSVPMHTALRLAAPLLRRVRALNPRAHLTCYGHYAALNAAYLRDAGVDSVLAGEIEEPLARLALTLAGGGLPETPSAVHLGRQRPLVPAREGLPPLDRYAHLEMDGSHRATAAVETSRGCAHRCLHCPLTPVYGGRLRVVPADVVLADIRQVVALGAEHITFADPDFFNGVRHSLMVARAMHAEFPHLTFDATIKVEHLLEHRALLPELRDLGCAFIVSAVESISDSVLAALEKGHTGADVLAALDVTRAAGIPLRPSLLPFTPWATLDDYLALLTFVERHDLVAHLDPVQYAVRLLVPPGSSLLGRPWMDRHLGPLAPDEFAYAWRHPDPRMDALAAEVAHIAADGARARDEAAATFERIAARAWALAGSGRPAVAGGERRTGGRPPRLTEPWFC